MRGVAASRPESAVVRPHTKRLAVAWCRAHRRVVVGSSLILAQLGHTRTSSAKKLLLLLRHGRHRHVNEGFHKNSLSVCGNGGFTVDSTPKTSVKGSGQK